jgi:hypothetical protein
VKDWYMYCMGPATNDLSAWGNGGPRAWHRGHRIAARVPASLLVSLPEFSDLPQWLVSFSGAIEGKGGIMREPLDDMGRDSALMPPSFHWGPLSWTGLGEAGAAGHSGGTYGGRFGGGSGSEVWWTSKFFSFTFPLTRMAVCL